MTRRVQPYLALVTAVVLVLAACGQATPAPTAAPLKVSLRLPWITNTQFAGAYVALDKGWFKDEGLDVDIRAGGIDKNSITLVAAGSDTFGIHDTGSLILARAQGMPLKAIGTIFQIHPGGVMALADSGINSMADFKGRTIGYQEGGPWMLTQAMMQANGVSVDDVKKVTVQYDISPLLNKQVDLFTIYATNEPLIAERQGFKVKVFLPYDNGVKTAADTVFAREDFLQQHPEAARGFMKALIRGWEYALANKDEATAIVLKYAPDLDKATELAQLQAEEPFILNDEAKANSIGYMSLEKWQNIYNVLKAQGQLTVDVDVSQMFTTEFLPKK